MRKTPTIQTATTRDEKSIQTPLDDITKSTLPTYGLILTLAHLRLGLAGSIQLKSSLSMQTERKVRVRIKYARIILK